MLFRLDNFFLSICYQFIKYLLATGSGITSNQRYQQISVSHKSIYSSEYLRSHCKHFQQTLPLCNATLCSLEYFVFKKPNLNKCR